VTLLALALGAPALARQDAPAAPAAPKSDGAPEAKMYERMDKEDREALAANLGYGVPAFPTGLQWLGGEPWDHDGFRDKVTVIGSREVIKAAIRKPIRRATGLAGRLQGGGRGR
jgi:hypothetical protein